MERKNSCTFKQAKAKLFYVYFSKLYRHLYFKFKFVQIFFYLEPEPAAWLEPEPGQDWTGSTTLGRGFLLWLYPDNPVDGIWERQPSKARTNYVFRSNNCRVPVPM